MGKNNGKKKGRRTPFAKWTSFMRKLDNELEEAKRNNKPKKSDKVADKK